MQRILFKPFFLFILAAAPSPQINAPSSSVAPGDGMTTEEREMDAQWVPLELCFGVPLFSEAANLAVCKKVRDCFWLKIMDYNYIVRRFDRN